MTDQTAEQQLAAIRRQMAAPGPTLEQQAEWDTADQAMARRIRTSRPGVPLHHAFATLQTLRTIQWIDVAAEERSSRPDPVEGGHEAALGQTEARLTRLQTRVQNVADEARGSIRDWLIDALADLPDPRQPSTARPAPDDSDPADLTGYLAPEPAIRCLTAAADTVTRPRCPHCQMPHDLEPGSPPVTVCASIRQRIDEAERLHGEGDHRLCCRADCDVLQQRDTETVPDDRPSRLADLRAEIAAALEAADYSGTMRRGDLADSIMPVFYRAWPWLQAEAEDAVDIARLRADKTALQAALTDTLTVRRQHIGRLTQRATELEAERDRLTDELRQYAEVESADAAAGSYALRAEHAEQQRDQLADTLRQVLAKFHPVHTADRRTVKGHTARVTPADHERWTAMLGQQPEPSPAAAIEVRDPRPRCEGSPTLIPRQLMADHMRDTHPEEQQP